MPDVSGLLHPGYPESSDDRPEQPGDCQKYPERVCLCSFYDTHRHIVDKLPSSCVFKLCTLSIYSANMLALTLIALAHLTALSSCSHRLLCSRLCCVHVVSGLSGLLSDRFEGARQRLAPFILMWPERSTDRTCCLQRERGAI